MTLLDGVTRRSRDAHAIEELVQQIEHEAGSVDIVCSAAGVFEPMWATALDLDSYRRVLALNLDAPVLLAVSCGRRMVERRYGRNLSVTSIHGRRGDQNTYLTGQVVAADGAVTITF
jgi:NAD(P)-dependent dehydrogenase (short-subunit alcohol dehydrogenase family)